MDVEINHRHLEKALLECPINTNANCLLVQAVAEALHTNTTFVFAGVTTFGPLRTVPEDSAKVKDLTNLFDARTEESLKELRELLPVTVRMERYQ